MRVLLVDNEPDAITFLTDSLESWGHDVILIESNTKILPKLHELNGHVDIIICDLKVSHTEETTLVETIRHNFHDIDFILLISAEGFLRFSIALELGACAYIEHSIKAEELKLIINQIEEQRRTKRQIKTIGKSFVQEEIITNSLKDQLFARRLQRHIIPKDFSWLPRTNITIRHLPMNAVGGDFIDIRPYGERQALIMVADVCGHGTSAAFGSIALKSWFTSLDFNLTPPEILSKADRMISDIFPEEFLITAFCALYDEKDHSITYSIAGAPNPFIISLNKTCRILEGKGAALGLSNEEERESLTDYLQPNETLYIFTDGLTYNSQQLLQTMCDDIKENEEIRNEFFNYSHFISRLLDAAIQNEPVRAYSDDISMVAIGQAKPLSFSDPKVNLEDKTIMLIEDNPAVHVVIKHIIQKENGHFHGEFDAVDCVEKLKEIIPDLLILDVMMPQVNGIEALKEIRKEFPTLPVIIISALPENQVARIGLELNTASFMQKPFGPKELIHTMKSALNYRPDKEQIQFEDLKQGWMEFVISSSPSILDLLSRYLTSLARQPVPPAILSDVIYCIREIAGNAIEWGNLNNPEFKVRVSTVFLDDRVMVKIADEGPGFNTMRFFKESDLIELQECRQQTGKREGGFGLPIVQQKMDSVTFNEKGNAVLMVKKF